MHKINILIKNKSILMNTRQLTMETTNSEQQEQTSIHELDVKKRSDYLMNYFLISFFLAGLLLAFFYNTWLIAAGVGGFSLLVYYTAKIALPDSDLYQYVLSVVFAIFMAQFLYQMH